MNVREGSKSARKSCSERLAAIKMSLFAYMWFQKMHYVFVHQIFCEEFVISESEDRQVHIVFLQSLKALQCHDWTAIMMWESEERDVLAFWLSCF